MAIVATNAIIRQSALRSRSIGLVDVWRNATRARPDPRATGTARAAPAAVNSRLSSSICDKSRDREAPMATRTASSRWRALARARFSVARLTAVMRSTSPVSPSSSGRDLPCVVRRRLTPRPAGNTPNRRPRYPSMSSLPYPVGMVASRMPGLRIRICSFASPIVQSGLRRPMTVSHQRSLSSTRASHSAAEQTGSTMSNARPTSRPVNEGGVTPTMVNDWSRSVRVRPMADSRPPR